MIPPLIVVFPVKVVVPPTVKLSPTFKFCPIPTPPVTFKAAVEFMLEFTLSSPRCYSHNVPFEEVRVILVLLLESLIFKYINMLYP